MKRFILSGATSLWLVSVIIAMAFTACSKKNETQTAAAISAESYAKILNGDLSDFAGYWVNGEDSRVELKHNGVFGNYDDFSDVEIMNFHKNTNGAYTWTIATEWFGSTITIYPAGIDVMGGNGILQTDTTKVRITAVDIPYRSAEVFYREGQVPAAHFADEREGGPGDDYEALPPGFGYPYTAILDGDFSDFAGRWVNDHGGGWVDLTKDGLLQDIGYSISNIKKIGNAYSWDLSTGVVSMPVFLFPAGTEITDEDNRRIQTDITKDRIAIDRRYSNQVYYLQGGMSAQIALDHEELRAGSSVTGVVGRDWIERYNIRSVDTFYILLEIESEVEILLDVYNGQQFITSSFDNSGEYHSRFEIAAQPNTVYLLEVSSYVRDVTEAAFRITAHLSQ